MAVTGTGLKGASRSGRINNLKAGVDFQSASTQLFSGKPDRPVHANLFREPDVRLDRAHLGAVAQQTPDPAGRPLHGSAGSAGLGGRGKPFADLRLCEDKEEQHRKDRADETKMPTNSVAEMPIRTRRDCVAEGNGSAESLTGPDPALLIGCRRDADCTWARMNSLEKDFGSARVSRPCA